MPEASITNEANRLNSLRKGDLVNLLEARNYPTEAELKDIPFGAVLSDTGKGDDYFVYHMELICKSMNNLLEFDPTKILSDLTKQERDRDNDRDKRDQWNNFYETMNDIKGRITKDKPCVDLLRIAVLYHDIGKSIRRERHPYEGWHVLNELHPNDTEHLRSILKDDKYDFNHLAKLVKYHEIFGTVSTGECSMPIFCSLIPFMAGKEDIKDIMQLFSMLLMMNIADIDAALKGRSYVFNWENVPGADSEKLKKSLEERLNRKLVSDFERSGDEIKVSVDDGKFILIKRNDSTNEIIVEIKGREIEPEKKQPIYKKIENTQGIYDIEKRLEGITYYQALPLVEDWKKLKEIIEGEGGDRKKIMTRLIEYEKSLDRTAERLKRLLRESSPPEKSSEYTRKLVEEIFTLNFRNEDLFEFCNDYAHFYRMDYLKRFLENYQKKAKQVPALQVGSSIVDIMDSIVKEYHNTLSKDNMELIGVEFSALKGRISDEIVNLMIPKEYKEDHAYSAFKEYKKPMNWILDEISVFKLKM
jgi:hypothetical protein